MGFRRFVLVAVFTLASFSTFASEKLFWETIAQFEENWLKSENEAEHLLHLAEQHYLNSNKTGLMLSALVIKKFDFLKYYSSPYKTIAHLESHIDDVLVHHNFYDVYLSELTILYFRVGQLDAYEKALKKLSQRNSNTFLSTVKLTTQPSEKNYSLLYSFCEKWCNFLLYHLAKAKYYEASGQYLLLNNYIDQVVSEHYRLEDLRSKFFLAYLFVVTKCQKTNEQELHDLREAVIGDIKHLRGFYNDLVVIMNKPCK